MLHCFDTFKPFRFLSSWTWRVSRDQVESSFLGLIPTCHGTPSSHPYHVGTIFVDYTLLLISPPAFPAKHLFKLHASQYNCSIKCYQTDSGNFSSKEFRAHCSQQKQHVQFCGVNAHHQNGMAERRACSITEHAHTMIIHVMISWPDTTSETLWPVVLQLAVYLHNNTPEISGLTPTKIFTRIKSRINCFLDFHPFGCFHLCFEPYFASTS